MWAGALLLALLLGPASGAAPSGVCDVTQPPYSARCDNATDAAPAIQRALDDPACAAVLIAAPLPCVSRALNLTAMSGRALLIAPGSELAAWRDPRTYSLTAHNSMFLSATDGDGAWTGPHVRGFTLAGGGRIVGGGRAWWPLGESVVRPRTLWLPNCSDVTVANITIVDSPAWNLGFRGDSVSVSGVRVESGMDACGGYGSAPNTDGVNFGGHGLRVSGLWVHNGDDCIPITTGNDGTTSDVLVQGAHCECGTNGGVIFNQGGTVRDVVFDGMTVHSTNQGAGVKLSRPGRNATGGLVANVSWLNLRVTAPRNAALYTNVFGEDAASCALPPKPDLPRWLTVTGALFRNVSADLSVAGQAAGCFLFTPGAPGSGFVFEDVQVRAAGGSSRAAAPYACHNTRGFSAQGDTAPAPCP